MLQACFSIISKERALCKTGAHTGCHEFATSSRVVIWSAPMNPVMDSVRDERISGESDRSPANCHPKSKVGTVSNNVAGCSKCVTECNFDCRNVRVYRSGPGARPDFR